ncbi:MAG: CRISPR-associated protein Csn1, partial [Bacteroidaceae bacterium]|nr:CRISPR-associated protein Csn1 [Bacteroidaceae bacterium]
DRRLLHICIRDSHSTIVHIEYARELNNANQRAAILQRQRELEKKHEQYAAEIRKLGIEPTQTDIIKYQLWEEQDRICLYTGKTIGVWDFLGANPQFDIEHTIPQSVGGDSMQENLTLCDCQYNRQVKRAMIPSQLSDYDAILERIKPWKQRIDDLSKQIDRLSHGRSSDKEANDKRIQKKNRLKLELDYWRGKCMRFEMKEVPEGFARRQGAGIGLVYKYAALYLKSYFKDIEHPERRQIYSVKGVTTSDFRKMWGIQKEYEKKSRDSHTHHCIDAIVIACIGKREYDTAARYYHSLEEYEAGRASKPHFTKPWPTFTEDVKRIAEEQLVVHDTKDNMPKKASRKIEVKGKGKVVAKGDCARGSLHNDTYYGAIEKGGKVCYVVRRKLSDLKESDVENIVDDAVRDIVEQALKDKKDLKKDIIWMNEEKGIPINKVRCYATSVTSPLNIRQHRDRSAKEYKHQFHVTNDRNYCMVIYEGKQDGKVKRDFQVVSMLDAVSHFKKSNVQGDSSSMEQPFGENVLPLKHIIRVGSNVLLFEGSAEEIRLADIRELARRLYKVVALDKNGRIFFRHSTESRSAKEVKYAIGAYVQGEDLRVAIRMSYLQFNALVAGQDFELTPLGEIKFN